MASKNPRSKQGPAARTPSQRSPDARPPAATGAKPRGKARRPTREEVLKEAKGRGEDAAIAVVAQATKGGMRGKPPAGQRPPRAEVTMPAKAEPPGPGRKAVAGASKAKTSGARQGARAPTPETVVATAKRQASDAARVVVAGAGKKKGAAGARGPTTAKTPRATAAVAAPPGARAHTPGPSRVPTEPAPATPLAPLPVQIPGAEPGPRGPILPLELDTGKIEESLKKLGGELSHWARQGRYTKVRFKFRGKPLLPDLPLAAVVAAEGLTFYWGGILRALLMNVAGRSLLDVELVHDAEKEVQAGKEALLSGDLEAALAHFRRAVDMNRDGAAGYLNLGVALKLGGDRPAAREALQRAQELDVEGPLGAEAGRLLATLGN